MSLPSPTEYENGEPPPHDPPLDSSFPRTRESRFIPHRIGLDTRFRGYDVIRIASANRPGTYFPRVHWPVDIRQAQGRRGKPTRS
jgi:hypothetical protein